MTTEQGMEFGFGTQIRKSPYFDATVRWGARDFSVYNHMYIPCLLYTSPSPRDVEESRMPSSA